MNYYIEKIIKDFCYTMVKYYADKLDMFSGFINEVVNNKTGEKYILTFKIEKGENTNERDSDN